MDKYSRTKARGLILAAWVLAGTPLAHAESWGVDAATSISSGLIDRGETLATLNNETNFTLIHALDFGEVYGGLYRISPIGAEASAFDEEVDYTIGFAFEQSRIAIDASANYLTYPGSAEAASLELAAEIGLEHFLSPAIAGFYDVDLDVYGLEVTTAPSYEMGSWMLTGILRVGAVSSDEEDYVYGGIESVAGRQLSRTLGVEGFARFEIADADNFVSNVQNNEVAETRTDGVAIGLRLTFQN